MNLANDLSKENDNDPIISVVRTLTYTGPKTWIDKTLAQGSVPAEGKYDINYNKSISSVMNFLPKERKYVSPKAQKLLESLDLRPYRDPRYTDLEAYILELEQRDVLPMDFEIEGASFKAIVKALDKRFYRLLKELQKEKSE